MTPIQPVSIAGIEFDALIDSEESYEAEVPEYPTDSGFSVSDNVAVGALKLSMTLYLTATPITWRSSHGTGEDRLLSIPDKLVKLYEEREPITVYTQDKTYVNMVIKTISIKRDEETGAAREIPVELQQIYVTSSEKVDIPADLPHAGTTQSDSGTASTGTASTTSTSGSSGSSSGSGSSGSSSGSGSTNNTTSSLGSSYIDTGGTAADALFHNIGIDKAVDFVFDALGGG